MIQILLNAPSKVTFAEGCPTVAGMPDPLISVILTPGETVKQWPLL